MLLKRRDQQVKVEDAGQLQIRPLREGLVLQEATRQSRGQSQRPAEGESGGNRGRNTTGATRRSQRRSVDKQERLDFVEAPKKRHKKAYDI